MTKPAHVIEATQLLTDQHAEVDALFKVIEKGGRGKEDAFLDLADKLAAHTTIEEKIFYPAIMTKGTEDQLHEAVEEHLAAKRLLADLLAMDPDDEQFDAKIKVLKEELEHHNHEEEEGKLFPKVRGMLSADQRAALGNEMMATFEQLMTTTPRNKVPSEIDAAAELPAA